MTNPTNEDAVQVRVQKLRALLNIGGPAPEISVTLDDAIWLAFLEHYESSSADYEDPSIEIDTDSLPALYFASREFQWDCAMEGLGQFVSNLAHALTAVEKVFYELGRPDLAEVIPRVKAACDAHMAETGKSMRQWADSLPCDGTEDALETWLGDIDDEIELMNPDLTNERLSWLIARREKFIEQLS